ncbi:MAG TPA: hypothetical protein VMH39_02630 [Gemmatimonadaceae bacterium]|nr:hypothetical protein [Gemmatimonadaceae bacterium]
MRSGVAVPIVDHRQFSTGAAVLAIGVLAYVVARPAGSVYFLPRGLSFPVRVPPSLQGVAGWIPTFAHTLAFCLFSSAVLAGLPAGSSSGNDSTDMMLRARLDMGFGGSGAAGSATGPAVRSAAICLGWFMIEALFEIGQRRDVSPWLVQRLPAWFDHVALLANARPYFTRGTFDPADLAAAAAGAAVAFLALLRLSPGAERGHHPAPLPGVVT